MNVALCVLAFWPFVVLVLEIECLGDPKVCVSSELLAPFESLDESYGVTSILSMYSFGSAMIGSRMSVRSMMMVWPRVPSVIVRTSYSNRSPSLLMYVMLISGLLVRPR